MGVFGYMYTVKSFEFEAHQLKSVAHPLALQISMFKRWIMVIRRHLFLAVIFIVKEYVTELFP